MPQVKHVVLLRFKADTPDATIADIFASLDGLRDKIPGLLDFSGGAFFSDEGLGRNYTHGFVMTFADVASRDGYLPHPDHEVVKGSILPHLDGGIDGVLAFDWKCE